MEANSVMGKHEFVITVSNILPEFKSLPDWQKEAAYSQFSRDIEETTWDNDHLIRPNWGKSCSRPDNLISTCV